MARERGPYDVEPRLGKEPGPTSHHWWAIALKSLVIGVIAIVVISILVVVVAVTGFQTLR